MRKMEIVMVKIYTKFGTYVVSKNSMTMVTHKEFFFCLDGWNMQSFFAVKGKENIDWMFYKPTIMLILN